MTDQVRPEEVADHLDSAADIIEKEGWIQGDFGFHNRGFCILGSLMWVTSQKEGHRFMLRSGVEQDEAERLLVQRVGTLSVWNDRPGRTKQEVLDLLRLTAKEARS